MLFPTLLTLSLGALSLAAPLSSRQSCSSGFYIIVARGTGEAAGEGKPGAVATLIEQQIPNSQSVAVNYPATLDDYPSSVSAGISNTESLIQNYVNSCPNGQIVLVGYSQGGEVMTDVLAGGVDKPAPISSQYAQNIAAVVVFGDPTFTVGQSFDVGTATKSGIFSRGGSSLALLNTYASILQSYCNEHDPFCASGDDLDVHYNEVADYEQAAANFAASMYNSQ